MSEWSLESEICKLAHVENFESALCNLGILSTRDESFIIRRDDEWIRGGAETYIYRFWIKREEQAEIGYILKACVAFTPGYSLEKTLQDWLARRKLVAEAGISTPTLITVGNGTIVEELVPYTLLTVLKDQSSPAKRKKILRDLAIWVGTLSRLRFAHVDPFSDLHSHGDDVVVIDYGQDLGPPDVVEQPRLSYYEDLIKQLDIWKIEVNNELINDMYSAFRIAADDPDIRIFH